MRKKDFYKKKNTNNVPRINNSDAMETVERSTISRKRYGVIVSAVSDISLISDALTNIETVLGEDLIVSIIFPKKKYAYTPKELAEIEKVIRNCKELPITYFAPKSMATVVNALAEKTERIVFINSDERLQEYYPKYVDAFTNANPDCAALFWTALYDHEDLPQFFVNIPKSGIYYIEQGLENLEFPASISGGSLVLVLNNFAMIGETVIDIFAEVAKHCGRYGVINALTNTRIRPAVSKKKWLISCIIPIYNVANYLREAVDSVIAQTIGFKENVQLILVNDGSVDDSGMICEEYAKLYPENVVYIEQENKGVSAARNNGLELADGEYIAYIDGDDIFDSRHFEAAVEFITKHRDDIDFVAFKLNIFGDVKPGQEHPLNYKFRKTGVVDVVKNFNYTIMHVTGMVLKGDVAKKHHFSTKLKYAEDADYIYHILQDKQKYGMICDPVFNYRRGHDGSAITGSIHSVAWYEKFLILPRKLIELDLDRFGEVSRYIQHMIMYDIQWYKLEEIPEDVRDFVDIDKLFLELEYIIKYIDDDIIKGARFLSYWQKYYFRKVKNGVPQFKQLEILPAFYFGDDVFETLNPVVYLAIFEEYDGKIYISGHYHLAQYDHFNLVASYKNEFYRSTRLQATYKNEFYLGCAIQKPCVFELNIPFTGEGTLLLYIEADGYGLFPVRMGFTYNCRMRGKNGAFVLGDKSIILRTAKPNVFDIKEFSLTSLPSIVNNYVAKSYDKQQYKADVILLHEYIKLYQLMIKRRIWLFMDRHNKADDNAEHLFRYTVALNDGIEKYYVISADCNDYERMKQYGNVVEFGSKTHKLLHLFAEKYIASNFDFPYIFPFGTDEQIQLFQPLCKAKFVFLQHGITSDDMSKVLNKWVKNCKTIVTSTRQEYETISSMTYGYKDTPVVLLSGFPRYDNLCDNKGKNITFIFSWRRELAKGFGMFEYNPNFVKSKYFQAINSVLQNERLLLAAQQYGYAIIFRPHPAVYIQKDDFKFNNSVVFLPNDTPYGQLYADSALMITDFSSAIFDFAYLKKPILYYQFEDNSWNSNWGKGYFDRETMGFGELVHTEDELVDAIIEHMKNGCVMSELYQKRVDNFFEYNDKNNCKRVYDAILEV